jgi:peptide/nickel transport system substrate-binding protein
MSLIFLSGDIVSMAHLMRWYVVLATMLLAATMPSAAAKDDRLRIGIKGDIASLDPHILNETLTLGVLSNVMEGLVRRDADLKLQPGLATQWETPSPLHWRFHLRRDVRFHDGAPFTAGNVLFTFERAREARSQMRSRIPDGARFIAVDTHTVDVYLEKPNPILHANWESLLIMSRPWAERHGLADRERFHNQPPHSGERHRALSRHLASRRPSHPLRAPSPVVGRGTRPCKAG